ncbi:uncharacterized protein LOC113004302 [Solenopsis invicta]|uniref:uncharacterized protein LOC113004302 n=1 Tax=Solenopsis invicta TaxID=13686 RepID=UPI00193E3BC2|nr:uncharacterized protein LOC113004302 [Solenopsis invicta]
MHSTLFDNLTSLYENVLEVWENIQRNAIEMHENNQCRTTCKDMGNGARIDFDANVFDSTLSGILDLAFWEEGTNGRKKGAKTIACHIKSWTGKNRLSKRNIVHRVVETWSPKSNHSHIWHEPYNILIKFYGNFKRILGNLWR